MVRHPEELLTIMREQPGKETRYMNDAQELLIHLGLAFPEIRLS